MNRKVTFWALLLILMSAIPVLAQTDTVKLRLSRDFGFGLGSRVQGRFSFRVEGPETLEKVLFYIDGELIGEDATPPYRYQFQTENYDLGSHQMSAVGITTDGREIQSNKIQRNFVSGADSTNLELWIIIPILIIAIGGRIISARISNRGQKKQGQPAIDGPFGTTVCPKCGRPFAMHIWGLNVVAGKFDRCPHCRKWSLVRRAHPDVVQEAAQAMMAEETAVLDPHSRSDEDKLKKQLDESRFDPPS